MSPDENFTDHLESKRPRGVSASDLAEDGESPGKNSTPFQSPACACRGRGPKTSFNELLTRAISSVRGSSDAQRHILERLSDLRTRFEEGQLRVFKTKKIFEISVRTLSR
jgi:hypothetical protein